MRTRVELRRVLDGVLLAGDRASEPLRRTRSRQGLDGVLALALEQAGLPAGPGEWLWSRHRATWLGPDCVVKVARLPYGESSIARDTTARAWIHRHLPALSPLVPRCLGTGYDDGLLWSVESRLPGAHRPGVDVGSFLELARQHSERWTRVDGAWTEAELVDPARRLDRIAGTTAVSRWALGTAAGLHGRVVGLGLVHGDLWSANVLVTDGRVSGVIDWDQWAPDQPAFHDRLHARIYPRLAGGSLGNRVRELLVRGEGGTPEVLADCHRAGVGLPDALIWYWLRHVSRMLHEPGHGDNPRWLHHNLAPMATYLHERRT